MGGSKGEGGGMSAVRLGRGIEGLVVMGGVSAKDVMIREERHRMGDGRFEQRIFLSMGAGYGSWEL